MATLEARVAELITSLGADVKSLTSQIAALKNSSVNFPSYAPSGLQNTYDPVTNLYNFKGSNTKRTRAALARVMGGGRMDVFTISDSIMIGFDGTNTKEGRSIPRQVGRGLTRMLGTTPAGSGLVAPAAYGTVNPSDHYAITGTVSLLVGVATMYAGSTLTFTSEQPGTIADVYYGNISTSFTVSIDGGAPVTVNPTGASSVGRYRVTGLADTTHTIKVTSLSNWCYISAMAVQRSAGIAIHNMGWGGGRAAGGGTGLSWTDTTTAGNNIQFWRKGALDASGYTPDLVLISLGANDINAGDTPANVIAALTTIKGWYPNSDYMFLLWPGIPATPIANWEAFCAALYTFADTVDVPILDLRDRYGTSAEYVSMGLAGADGIHPIEGAQREWGRVLASAYAGAGVSPVITVPTGAVAATEVPEGTVLIEYTP